MTSLTNPKSGAFWTGIFASVFPAAAPPWIFVATAAIIAALSAGWHCGLAYFFSSQIVQTTYKRIRHWIDAVCGAFLIGLGLRLAATR
jgi:threonine/homoserine/homoserine lactone efflux protein